MTRIVTSAPTHRAFMTKPQWQHPGRREFVHGKVQPLHQPRNRLWFWLQFGVMAGCLVYALYEVVPS
jgi:hypothetical protein